MQNHLLILLFIFLYPKMFWGQPTVNIQLQATETVFSQWMFIGLDTTATNCLDPQLGEQECPPSAPPGAFHIVFYLAPYGCPALTMWKDYRNAPSFPYSGQVQHTINWQRSSPGTAITIQYNLPAGATMTIQDNITGTLWTIGPFTGSGTAVIPGTGIPGSLTSAHLIMDYDNIVPVELLSFTASILQNEKVVQLNWSTATETNNSGFEVERLQDSNIERLKDWITIGFVPGFGTTTKPKLYSFIDEDISTGTYKYRLKQVDFDGSFEYSNEIEVEVDFTPKEFVLYQNYPNPFNPTTTIKYEIPGQARNDNVLVTLKVYDVLGNEVATLVNEEKQSGIYEVQFNSHSDEGQNLSSGIYFYQLKAGDFISIKKMILLR